MNSPASQSREPAGRPRAAIQFIVLLGVVSLFADMTYEGARAITGPYLGLLGASATTVGIVVGFGELVGFSLRAISGYWADRTGRYWSIIIFGYVVNLLAVPLLAIAGHWWIAAALIICERTGKAIRTPPRDAMLSQATAKVGHGWGFGVHEALDQAGATLGPLLVALVLYLQDGYRAAFAFLAIPAMLSIGTLLLARKLYPSPRGAEPRQAVSAIGFKHAYWLYVAGAASLAFGYIDYPLIAFHFETTGAVPKEWIPVFYAVAMAVDGLAALLLGYWYDRRGLAVLVAAIALASLFTPLAFLGGFGAGLLAAALWGFGMAVQESVLKAAIAGQSDAGQRGSAFGIFNAAFGIAWFAGSALMGMLYDLSPSLLVLFSVVFQLAAIPYFLLGHVTGAEIWKREDPPA